MGHSDLIIHRPQGFDDRSLLCSLHRLIASGSCFGEELAAIAFELVVADGLGSQIRCTAGDPCRGRGPGSGSLVSREAYSCRRFCLIVCWSLCEHFVALADPHLLCSTSCSALKCSNRPGPVGLLPKHAISECPADPQQITQVVIDGARRRRRIMLPLEF